MGSAPSRHLSTIGAMTTGSLRPYRMLDDGIQRLWPYRMAPCSSFQVTTTIKSRVISRKSGDSSRTPVYKKARMNTSQRSRRLKHPCYILACFLLRPAKYSLPGPRQSRSSLQ
jgi:hypothetical protein